MWASAQGALLCQTEDTHRAAVARLGREADRLAENAHRVVAQETLEQNSLDKKRMSRGRRPGEPWPPVVKRQVVSQYGYFMIGGQIREMRQVISVDGKKTGGGVNPLDMLALGVTSDNDSKRLRLLEQFEKHGLHGVATDFGQLILLFAKGNTQKFEINYTRSETVDKQDFLIYTYQQMDGPESFTIFESDRPVKMKLKGEIWVRRTDLLPARVVLDVEHDEKKEKVRDLSHVDYAISAFGFLVPSFVEHQQFRNGMLHVEDRFTYTPFTEIGAPAQ
jgi:hypothetical protein